MLDIYEVFEEFKFTNAIWVLVIPSVMMGIDFVTGYLKAWVHNDIISAKMRAGLAKKIGELTILLMGKLFEFGMSLPVYIMNAVSFYIIFMEFISIMENLNAIGVPIPKFIKKSLRSINKKILEEDFSEEAKDILKKKVRRKEEKK